MWKDFFYFSKGQRNGIIVLIILILIVLILNHTLPLFSPETHTKDIAFFEEVEQFKKSLLSRDSLKQLEFERRQSERITFAKTSPKFSKNISDNYSLFAFNPNTADSIVFIQLGLKPYVVSNIIKYRLKGGVFKTEEGFGKIYGISGEKYNELKPYIKIEREERPSNFEMEAVEKMLETYVELNSADTTELMRIKGIGSYLARQIVKFRRETGGFVSVEQLREIPYMRAENFERVVDYCIVDTSLVQQIEVNSASVDKMKKHPYINFYQAKAIYELRRVKGKIADIKELTKLPDFTEEDIVRLKPYLSFN